MPLLLTAFLKRLEDFIPTCMLFSAALAACFYYYSEKEYSKAEDLEKVQTSIASLDQTIEKRFDQTITRIALSDTEGQITSLQAQIRIKQAAIEDSQAIAQGINPTDRAAISKSTRIIADLNTELETLRRQLEAEQTRVRGLRQNMSDFSLNN